MQTDNRVVAWRCKEMDGEQRKRKGKKKGPKTLASVEMLTTLGTIFASTQPKSSHLKKSILLALSYTILIILPLLHLALDEIDELDDPEILSIFPPFSS